MLGTFKYLMAWHYVRAIPSVAAKADLSAARLKIAVSIAPDERR